MTWGAHAVDWQLKSLTHKNCNRPEADRNAQPPVKHTWQIAVQRVVEIGRIARQTVFAEHPAERIKPKGTIAAESCANPVCGLIPQRACCLRVRWHPATRFWQYTVTPTRGLWAAGL